MNIHSHYKIPKSLITVGLFAIACASLLIYHFTYAEEIFPRVQVGPIGVGGKTQSAAADALDQKIDHELGSGFTFLFKGKIVVINPVIIAPTDPDLTYTIVSFDTERMAEEAFNFGRDGNLLVNLGQSLSALVLGKQLPVYYSLDRAKFRETLKANFGRSESMAENAALIYENGLLKITEEKTGTKILYDKALDELDDQLKKLHFEPIAMERVVDEPKIKKSETLNLLGVAQKILTLAPLEFSYGKNKWAVDAQALGEWLIFEKSGTQAAIAFDGRVVNQFFDNMAEKVEVSPQDAKFKLETGRVVEFQASRSGKKVNKEATFALLKKNVLEEYKNSIQLVVDTADPSLTTANVNNLGIKELVGQAQTDFSGSPKNRRFNIGIGAEKLNGLLISPGEEFSLLKALGEISEKTGFLQELVIKGDRTIPEFGGGLCQIATTVFRSALSTGLPILERQNHSYRVPYYEPPVGVDATIYNPAPDLKFKNDTPGYILVRAFVEGNKLNFEFWGTNDGRLAEQTKPVITNRIPPPPKKIVETEDLEQGKLKCTERPHEGADARFTYKVTYPDGQIEEKVFRSHYRPWGEVCLIGKKKEVATAPTEVISQ